MFLIGNWKVRAVVLGREQIFPWLRHTWLLHSVGWRAGDCWHVAHKVNVKDSLIQQRVIWPKMSLWALTLRIYGLEEWKLYFIVVLKSWITTITKNYFHNHLLIKLTFHQRLFPLFLLFFYLRFMIFFKLFFFPMNALRILSFWSPSFKMYPLIRGKNRTRTFTQSLRNTLKIFPISD